jgi:hypothetical protein
MLKYTLLIFLLSTTSFSYAQFCNIDKGFQKLYWYKNVDNFGPLTVIDDWGIKNILEDKKGNIITWSTVQFLDSNNVYRRCKLLSKKTQSGTTIWSKLFVDEIEIGRIDLTSDNGFIFSLGQASESNLVKINENGLVEWATHFNNNNKYYGGGATRVIQLTNGNYIRVGNSIGVQPSNLFGFISCSDKNGKLLWHNFFNDVFLQNIKYVGGSGRNAKVIELQDGNILVSGWNNYAFDGIQIQSQPRFYLQKEMRLLVEFYGQTS